MKGSFDVAGERPRSSHTHSLKTTRHSRMCHDMEVQNTRNILLMTLCLCSSQNQNIHRLCLLGEIYFLNSHLPNNGWETLMLCDRVFRITAWKSIWSSPVCEKGDWCWCISQTRRGLRRDMALKRKTLNDMSAPPTNLTGLHLCSSRTVAVVWAQALGVYKYLLPFALFSLLHFTLPLPFITKNLQELYDDCLPSKGSNASLHDWGLPGLSTRKGRHLSSCVAKQTRTVIFNRMLMVATWKLSTIMSTTWYVCQKGRCDLTMEY